MWETSVQVYVVLYPSTFTLYQVHCTALLHCNESLVIVGSPAPVLFVCPAEQQTEIRIEATHGVT